MKKLLPILFLAFSTAMQAQHVFTFGVELVEASATERVYNFEVEDFQNIIAWQFSMHFDGTKMRFKEIRNPVLNYLNTSSFNEPTPGNLRSVWLDSDLNPDNFDTPTVLFQIVFELLTPDSTPLCFDESQEYFEFVVEEGPGNFYLSQLVIHDDCVSGLSIFLDPNATAEVAPAIPSPIKDVFLLSTGALAFTATLDQDLQLSLYDLTGTQLINFEKKEYTNGRHTMQCRPITPGIYILKAVAADGKESAVKVFAY